MAFDQDPYRTLGVARGASLDEVKRAYRRLAKANHPDAAGAAALPRFLAIQAAYERIAGPDEARGDGGGGRSATSRRPWDADSERAEATRRAYGGRARRARPSDGSRRTRDRPSQPSPPPSPEDELPPRERPKKRATMGSTSYDGADDGQFEPDWGGAAWYGSSSGTYWTLNPKEYADPRKHGPEYQARARRGRRTVAADTTAGTATTADASAPIPPDGLGDSRPSGAPPEAPPTHTTSSWWDATAGDPAHDAPRSDGPESAEPAGSEPARPRGPGAAPAGPAPAGPAPATARSSATVPVAGAPSALDELRAWFVADHPGVVIRVGRAVVGWAPIALGIGWLAGEITGCGRFAATCDASTAPFAWFAQLVALALLLLAPPLARIASIGTLAALAAAIPGALLLSATGANGESPAGRAVLGGSLVIAWVVGVALAVARETRGAAGVRSGDGGPVS